jgi:hypothetical protein
VGDPIALFALYKGQQPPAYGDNRNRLPDEDFPCFDVYVSCAKTGCTNVVLSAAGYWVSPGRALLMQPDLMASLSNAGGIINI